MMTIESNAAAVADLLGNALAVIPHARHEALKAVGEHVYKQDMENLQEIYEQPDTDLSTSSGFLGYYSSGEGHRRTGALKAAEELVVLAQDELVIQTGDAPIGPFDGKNPQDYAARRDHLTSRQAGYYWRERAADDGEHEAAEVYAERFMLEMPEGLVTL